MLYYYFDKIQSTQIFLNNLIKQEKHEEELILTLTFNQTHGIGSRGNTWDGAKKGIYFSFALPLDMLPRDLALQSSSIYFGWLFMQLLKRHNDSIWLKWPNDFYIKDGKIGGVMTQTARKYIICGMGINMLDDSRMALFNDSVDTKGLDNMEIVKDIFSLFGCKLDSIYCGPSPQYIESNLENSCLKTSWQAVLESYKVEFYKNSNFTTHVSAKDGLKKINLSQCQMQDDGSLMIDDEVFYSLR